MSEQKKLQIYTTTEIQEMANSMGPLFNKKPQDLFALMMIAVAENKHPAIAAQEYDIIQGRPSINSRSAQSRFQILGGWIEWVESTETKCTARFSHPQGADFTSTWTMQRAQTAGLAGKDNWKKHPAAMLRARVLGEGIRACYPACLSGMYTVEENRDDTSFSNKAFTPKTETPKAPTFEKQEPRNVTNVTPEDINDDENTEFELELQENDIEKDVPDSFSPLLDWEVALSEDVAAADIFSWLLTQQLDTQKMASALLDNAKDQGNVDIGLVRCAFLHPDLSTIKQKNSDLLTKIYFERTILPENDPEEIKSWVTRVSKFLSKDNA